MPEKRVPSPPKSVARKSLVAAMAVDATLFGGEGWVIGLGHRFAHISVGLAPTGMTTDQLQMTAFVVVLSIPTQPSRRNAATGLGGNGWTSERFR